MPATAEILALVNKAATEHELADTVTSELCEALQADSAFLLALRRNGRLEPLGATGLTAPQLDRVLADELLTGAMHGPRHSVHEGHDLLRIGARAVALCGAGEAVMGVARMSAQPFGYEELALLETVTESVAHSVARHRLVDERDDLFQRLERTNLGIAAALAAALEAKDAYTAEHARSIADMAVHVGVKLGMTLEQVRDLRLGAILHDIGKIAVPDAILNKPSALTAEEFEIVKGHTVAGEQILAPVPFLEAVREIVRHDHERWDGHGYPDGLRGAEIPLGSRIVFVVDAFHAMTSDRPYRIAMDEDEAVERLRAGAGTQFDPVVVQAFVRVLRRRRRLTNAASLEAPRT